MELLSNIIKLIDKFDLNSLKDKYCPFLSLLVLTLQTNFLFQFTIRTLTFHHNSHFESRSKFTMPTNFMIYFIKIQSFLDNP